MKYYIECVQVGFSGQLLIERWFGAKLKGNYFSTEDMLTGFKLISVK